MFRGILTGSTIVVAISLVPQAAAQCPPLLDLDGNDVVDSQDMLGASVESELIQLHACLNIPRGDLNLDSIVNFPDFLVMTTLFSQEGQSYADSDFNLDGRVDIRDFAILSSNFGQSDYKPEPPAVEPSTLTLSINSDNYIIINGELELGGISFLSPNGELAELDRPDPFVIQMIATPQEITLVHLGQTVSISGEVTTGARVMPGVDPSNILAEWFDLRSYEVYSNAEPNLDCNGDGVVDRMDLSCACGTRRVDLLLEELGLPPGDLDGDGEVAFADFLVLSGNYLQEVAEYTDGDTNCDGSVGFADFITLSANYGRTGADVGGNAVAVPEPQGKLSMLMIFAGMVASLRRRRCPSTWPAGHA